MERVKNQKARSAPGLRRPGYCMIRKASDLWQQARKLSGRAARGLLPWNTGSETQGLVRIPIQPGSVEYRFRPRLTLGG